MQIDIRHVNAPVSDALCEFAKRHIIRALQPLEAAVSHVDVCTQDGKMPGGVIDVECGVTVRGDSLKEPVIVTQHGPDAYAAILSACAHLREAASGIVAGQKRIRRAERVPSGAAPEGATTTCGREEVTAATSGSHPNIVVTAMDQERLRKLIQANHDARDRDAAEALADELDRAEVVEPERVADNVVTMNSRIVFKDERTGERREMSLVYPAESDPARGRVSVFAPVGAALLGLSVGQTIDWPMPEGQLKRYRVEQVLYQPEAAGDLNL